MRLANRFVLCLVTITVMGFAAVTAQAQSDSDFRILPPVASAPVYSSGASTQNVQVSLLSEEGVLKPGKTNHLGIRMHMRDGWHVYWENPGDSGLPTSIAWTLPQGVKADAILWPAPHAIHVGPLVNYGYEGDVLLIVPVHAAADLKAGADATISAHLEWLVCKDICVPESADLTLVLPVSGQAVRDEVTREIFEKARAQLPQPSLLKAQIGALGNEVWLHFTGLPIKKNLVTNVTFFPRASDVLDHAAPQELTVESDGFTLKTKRLVQTSLPATVDGVVVISENLEKGPVRQAFAVSASTMTSDELRKSQNAFSASGLWRALLFAFLGGLLLNLMPCVFPVLFIKALSLLEQARLKKRERQLHGLAYTAGVLTTFALLAGVLIALKLAGREIGWGFQLQEPLVVALLAWLILLLGFSFSGLFEFSGRFMGLGNRFAALPGQAGSFFTGVLAVVVATPCTAPFMGVAVGYALSQTSLHAFLVFETLALGLAFPFLILSFVPNLGSRLPKPGAWMQSLRQFLAFPLYATAAWLVWVLAVNAGPMAVAAVLAGGVAIAFALWLVGEFEPLRPRLQTLGRLGVLILLIAALGFCLSFLSHAAIGNGRANPSYRIAQDLLPEAYSEERLKELIAEGKPVFVNFTAAWCITCLVNENAVLATDSVRDFFASHNVAYLIGDWTREDPQITRALAQFGRSGVPLYVVYNGAQDTPIVLPQILTIGAIEEAISGK